MKYTNIFVALLALLVIAGCTTIPSGPIVSISSVEDEFDPGQEIVTSNFKSVEEFEEFIKSYSGQGGYYGDGFVRSNAVAMDGLDMAVATPQMEVSGGSFEKSVEYSETNIQVAGVDEADIIKTDGEYIYTVTDKTLFIIKAYPGEDAEIVSTIQFDERPQGLFVNDEKLAVFGEFSDLDFFNEFDFTPRSGITFFEVYDISEKDDPELVKEYKFEGNYFQARMMDEYVYFVVQTGLQYRVYPLMPVFFDGVVQRTVPVTDIHYFNIPYRNPSLVTVHAVNIMDIDNEVDSKSVAVEYDLNMYMSQDNMFITYTEEINEWEITQDVMIDVMQRYLTDSDKELIEKIENTDSDVLSKWEKQQKILDILYIYEDFMDDDEREDLEEEIEMKVSEIMDEYEYLQYTIINKLGIDDGDISFEANGRVPGHVINQFSMDEYEDVLRMGTTVDARWSWKFDDRTESTNHVLTLDEDLEILDHLADIAEGESIYSTRFIKDKLYMVTFRQIDPFFVIDLSDPDDIEELGELKIPGFSRYLHPYDDETIIGIGRDASETGRAQGLKISLFDVSDFENPEEVAQFVTGENYAQSTAEFEHKAFLFDKEKELLVIPVYYNDYQDPEDSYNGAMVFKITKDEIEVRGIIDHSDGFERYGAAVERSLYIEDLLYTKSPNLLRINDLEDLESVKSIELESEFQGSYVIY